MQVDGKVPFITGLIIYHLIDNLTQTIHWCGTCQDLLLTFYKVYIYFVFGYYTVLFIVSFSFISVCVCVCVIA